MDAASEQLRARFVIACGPRQIRSAKAVHRVPCNRLRCATPPALRVPRSQMATGSSGPEKDTAQGGSQNPGLIKQNVQSRVRAVIADSTVSMSWNYDIDGDSLKVCHVWWFLTAFQNPSRCLYIFVVPWLKASGIGAQLTCSLGTDVLWYHTHGILFCFESHFPTPLDFASGGCLISSFAVIAFSTKLFREILPLKAENGWDQLWKEGTTPWDLGTVTPIIQDLIHKGDLPDGRALVPGCGVVSIQLAFLCSITFLCSSQVSFRFVLDAK